MGAHLKLYSKLDWLAPGGPFIARITREPINLPVLRQSEALMLLRDEPLDLSGYAAVFALPGRHVPEGAIPLPEDLTYLESGDIVRINPSAGDIRVWYRRASRTNFLLLTERCNSKCLMCSQPPRDIDDSYLLGELLQAIPLISAHTEHITFTGGEPTVLKGGFIELLQRMRSHLPFTALSVLTNGRSFAYRKLADRVASVQHPNLTLCIPLYSDVDRLHDFVVQADGAFDQTVRGIMNLAINHRRIEVRVVLHRQTYARLPQLARFIARNLPFVSHVALMGLEPTGFTKANMDALWIDPVNYMEELSEAVDTLAWAGISTSIYNQPLCLLPSHLWPYARKSISDWKNIYFEECNDCAVKAECAGFFASANIKRSANIRPVAKGIFASSNR